MSKKSNIIKFNPCIQLHKIGSNINKLAHRANNKFCQIWRENKFDLYVLNVLVWDGYILDKGKYEISEENPSLMVLNNKLGDLIEFRKK